MHDWHIMSTVRLTSTGYSCCMLITVCDLFCHPAINFVQNSYLSDVSYVRGNCNTSLNSDSSLSNLPSETFLSASLYFSKRGAY